MIVAEIGANVASIRFHFGSLEELKKAVLLRRFKPMVERRLADLARARARASGPLRVGRLLKLWFDPLLDMVVSEDAGERAFPRILARMLVEHEPEYEALLEQELAPHVDTFLDELARSLPGISPEEIAHRFDFVLGAFGHALNRVTDDAAAPEDHRRARIEGLTAELLRFAEAGMKARASAGSRFSIGSSIRAAPVRPPVASPSRRRR
jgi:AcrR family transcriptional regulator